MLLSPPLVPSSTTKRGFCVQLPGLIQTAAQNTNALFCCAIALAPGEGVWDLAKQIRGRTAPAKVLQCYLWTPRISNACAPFPLPSSPRARTRLLSVTGASLCGEVVTSGGKQWAVRGFRQACFKGLQKRSCRGGWGRA